ncbi:MAG TPA: hypothetical protein VGU26_03005, partial [Gaiellaceae bacterium]|nr:hypothetical protein [Gaiellaceae bacterium]
SHSSRSSLLHDTYAGSVANERRYAWLLLLTVEADFRGGKVTLPAARLYLFDDDDKIKAEQIVFFAAPN